MRQTLSKSALLIAGPTASGKSGLAMRLARVRNGVIINADSMQVYRELRLLTARPTEEEEAYAPHRLYGHVSGAEDYSVAHWLMEAKRAIANTWREQKLPIIVGGTGLYFMALERGLSEVPSIPLEIREKWRSHEGDLYGVLATRDPVMAARLAPSDRQRIVRALEVFDATGQSLAHFQAEGERNAFLNDVNVERHFVEVSREVLYDRAERRFDAMMQAGALDEVAALPALDPMKPVMKAIGVPELQAHLRGEISLQQAISDAKTATRHYIKRQTTWWRGQMKHWTTQSHSSEASA